MSPKINKKFLSVVVITKNEEKNIERCLKSVQPVADETLVVDSFSTDRTPEICQNFGVHFIQTKWKGYAATKNFANQKAQYDWILSIDADEALSPNLQDSILKAKERSDEFFKFNRFTNYCGQWIKHSGWYPELKLRLFNRNLAHWTGDYVHETLEIDHKGKIPVLPGHCYHYSYYSIEEHINQANNFSTLAAQELKRKNRSPGFFRILFKPPFKFIQMYFFKLGFLDGFYGFCIAMISAYTVFLKYAKLYQLNRENPNKKALS